MNPVKYLFLNFTVITAFRIEVNEKLHTRCDILMYRPTYKASKSLSFLNQALTDTMKHSSKVPFVFVIIDEHLDMYEGNLEFINIANSRHWDNNTMHSYVSRKHTAGNSPICSITITTAYHMLTGLPGLIVEEDQYSQYWGSWLRRSVQSAIGLLRFPNSHLLIGIVSVRERLERKLFLDQRDTLYMPPFLTFIVFLNKFGDVLAVRSPCRGGCASVKQIYQRHPLFVGHFDGLIKSLKPSSIKPKLILEYGLPINGCTLSTCNLWYRARPFIELAATFNYTLNLGPLGVDRSATYDAVVKIIMPTNYYVSSPTFVLSGDFANMHVRGSVPVYCSGKHKVESINILVVPLQSLDQQTWLILAFCLICVYHYTRMT